MARAAYQRLADFTPEDAPELGLKDVVQNWSKRRFSVLLYRLGFDDLPILLCILCTIANAFLALSPSNLPPTQGKAAINRDQLFRLRHPSQFIGFEKINRPSPPIPREFNNDPFLVSHVQASYPDTVLKESYATHMTRSGTVVPLTRKVVLSSDISTVFQFRAIDWGMENCELRLELPPEDTIIRRNNITVDIFRLNSTIPLDERILTFSNRPERVSKLTEIDIQYNQGVHWHRHVSCPSESLLTFEIACSDREENANCYAEWWQNGKHNVMVQTGETGSGLFIVQHASV